MTSVPRGSPAGGASVPASRQRPRLCSPDKLRLHWIRGVALAVLSALVGAASAARAEPRFAARTGLRCAHCHTSPTGGGKRSPYGALFAGTHLTLQRPGPRSWPPPRGGTTSSWLGGLVTTGEITSWLGIGADLRVASATTFGDDPTTTFEATQGTLYLALRPWPDRITLYIDEAIAAGGARNREAWAMVHGPWSTYLRGGWLIPPYGLRILDDAAYTRRVTGANFANSDVGLEAGVAFGPLFLALALTNGSFANQDTDALKAHWGLAELNLAPVRLGASWMYNPSEEGCRFMAGGFGAVHFGRFVAQAEVDFIADRPAARSGWTHQMALFAALDLQVVKGLNLSASYDYADAHLDLNQDRRQRFRFGLDLFPLRMMEVKLYYIMKQSETAQPIDAADRLEVLLHVFL